MKLEVGSRVLTPEGTGFVEGTGVVRLDGHDDKFVGVETVTQVFEDSAAPGPDLAGSGRIEEPEEESRWMTPFQQQVADAQDLGFEKEVVLVSRPTKAPHLRIVMDLAEHEAALFFLPRTE